MGAKFDHVLRYKYPLFYARRELSAFFSRIPGIFMPMARLLLTLQNQRSKIPYLLISDDSDLVIEGYPRSANSFAVVAFEMAQSRRVKTTHHLHLPINVALAAKKNMPCLVLIRDPDQAVLSLAVSFLKCDIGQALKEYVRFYTAVKPFIEHCIVASFRDVVKDFGSVIRRVNRKFGTDYQEFQHTPENVKRCFDRIDLESLWEERVSNVNEITMSRPSQERKRQKLELESKLRVRALASFRRSAYCLYRDFLS